MYTRVAMRLVVSLGTDAYSQAVSMERANRTLFDITMDSVTGDFESLTVYLQESNDIQNWRNTEDLAAIREPGYAMVETASGIASRYVRLKFVVAATTSASAVVAAGIDTADL